ncbi:BrnT family toxin [Trinickia dinghuensis]|uniref:BrnT family toxin n=1 Tax=Trinickia dinghuensis TaxID=2291023 RepID=A0A3D8K0P6_9BURK|nr:BrnT family toxin [Trinickia dinghuensis]RDU98652.1 BrnT family toxin [Trinickia dinghuensis]
MTYETTFDPAKSEANWRKHGVSLRLAASIDWSEVWSAPGGRRDYGELREVGYAQIEGYLYCTVFTQRGNTFRVISLRRANSREVKRYVEQTEAAHTDA